MPFDQVADIMAAEREEELADLNSWGDRIRKAHPWRWRWLLLKERCQRAADWVLDRPYWHHEDGDMVLRGLRSKERRKETENEDGTCT